MALLFFSAPTWPARHSTSKSNASTSLKFVQLRLKHAVVRCYIYCNEKKKRPYPSITGSPSSLERSARGNCVYIPSSDNWARMIPNKGLECGANRSYLAQCIHVHASKGNNISPPEERPAEMNSVGNLHVTH